MRRNTLEGLATSCSVYDGSPFVQTTAGALAMRLLCLLFLMSLLGGAIQINAQWLPTFTKESGDTIHYTYPVPDSLYVRNEAIILFRKEALQLHKLCVTLPSPTVDKPIDRTQSDLPPTLRSAYMNQSFHPDSILNNSAFASFLTSYGVTGIKRITIASPCKDTFSITRKGDTVNSEDYLWMYVTLSNDTAVPGLCTWGTILYQTDVQWMQPNFIYKFAKTPSDPLFGLQEFMAGTQIRTERAWDNQVGHYDVKIGIIDDGLDYRHCDLGTNFGPGNKVSSGWNYADKNNYLLGYSNHGTSVAGVAGALTNRNCVDGPYGVSGVAGGYGPDANNADLGLGAQLVALSVFQNGGARTTWVVDALREAACNTPGIGNHPKRGFACNVVNLSLGGPLHDQAFSNAVGYAHQHQVFVSAASGNNEPLNRNDYPASYNRSWVMKVGASTRSGINTNYSVDGDYVDYVAPVGNDVDGDRLVNTTLRNDAHGFVTGTSFAAPQVSGLAALILSESKDQEWDIVEPEDVDGIIKAACKKRNDEEDPWEYNQSYAKANGWGVIDAGRVFEMFDFGYRLHQYDASDNLSYSAWGPTRSVAFTTTGARKDPIAAASYYVQRRTVSKTVTIDVDGFEFSPEIPIYVWARSGGGADGGFSREEPCPQVPYTELFDGTEGGGPLDVGIRLTVSPPNQATVSLRTYQYRAFDVLGKEIGKYPKDSKIKLFYSVYAKPKVVSVPNEDATLAVDRLRIHPNPSSGIFQVLIDAGSTGSQVSNASSVIEIRDMLGVLYYSGTFGSSSKTIDVSHFPAQSYIVVVHYEHSTMSKIMQVVR
jgi:hypothetical protein